ncbi:MAG: acyltransferase family protein, partial [Plesiomonas sp.]
PLLHEWGFTGIPAFQGPFNHLSALPANVFLLQGLGRLSLSWNFPGWSLSVEWLCYMLFPLIIGLLPYGAKRNVWLPFLMLFVLYQMTLQTGTIDITSGPHALFRALCGFTTGMWLCQLSLPLWLKNALNHDVCLFAITGAILYLLHLGQTPHLNMAVYLLFICLVLSAANQNARHSWFMRLFDNRLTRFLGDISYSVYLWHVVILLVGVDALHHFDPAALRWWYAQTSISALLSAIALFTVILLGLSALTYRYLERPALHLLRRWPSFATEKFTAKKVID